MPSASLHHVHLFCSDIDATVAWWRDMLGAKVAVDEELAGARNVFLTVGDGRLHLYDQPPRTQAGDGEPGDGEPGDGEPGDGPGTGQGTAIHHIGIRADDLPALVDHMTSLGARFRSDIREHGHWRYIMVAAPDNVLLELFAFDDDRLTGALRAYFTA